MAFSRCTTALALLALSGSAMATDVHKLGDTELCTDLAVTMISGEPARTGFLQSLSQDEIIAELRSRQEQCADNALYLAMARERLAQQQERHARRHEGLIQALQQYGSQPNAAPPSPAQGTQTIRCHEPYNGTVSCTSTP
jgi:hypothetical protein